jgi:hypothetical protein
VLAEVAAQPQRPNGAVRPGERLQDLPRSVAATVVDVDELVVRGDALDARAEPVVELPEAVSAPVDRDDNAQLSQIRILREPLGGHARV